MTGHLFSFPDSTGIGTVTDGAPVAKVFVGTMRPRESGKRPPFDYTCESVSLRRSGYIDTIACLEQVCRFDLLPDLKLRHIVQTKFLQNFEGTFTRLGHMALLRLVDSLILLAAAAHLDRIVPVCGTLLLLHDNARAGLDNCDRNDISFRVVELCHANLFSDKARHKSFLRTRSIPPVTGVLFPHPRRPRYPACLRRRWSVESALEYPAVFCASGFRTDPATFYRHEANDSRGTARFESAAA